MKPYVSIKVKSNRKEDFVPLAIQRGDPCKVLSTTLPTLARMKWFNEKDWETIKSSVDKVFSDENAHKNR